MVFARLVRRGMLGSGALAACWRKRLGADRTGYRYGNVTQRGHRLLPDAPGLRVASGGDVTMALDRSLWC